MASIPLCPSLLSPFLLPYTTPGPLDVSSANLLLPLNVLSLGSSGLPCGALLIDTRGFSASAQVQPVPFTSLCLCPHYTTWFLGSPSGLPRLLSFCSSSCVRQELAVPKKKKTNRKPTQSGQPTPPWHSLVLSRTTQSKGTLSSLS